MPNVRDLGINSIPYTMQPPAIGDGGGGASDPTWSPDVGGLCEEITPAWSPPPTCKEDNEAITTGGCRDDPAWSPPPTCKRDAQSAFTPEAIAQVRQQIENQAASLE